MNVWCKKNPQHPLSSKKWKYFLRLLQATSEPGFFFVDCAFSVLVVGTLVVFVWRSVWVLCDLIIYPGDAAMSAWGSLVCNIFCLCPIIFIFIRSQWNAFCVFCSAIAQKHSCCIFVINSIQLKSVNWTFFLLAHCSADGELFVIIRRTVWQSVSMRIRFSLRRCCCPVERRSAAIWQWHEFYVLLTSVLADLLLCVKLWDVQTFSMCGQLRVKFNQNYICSIRMCDLCWILFNLSYIHTLLASLGLLWRSIVALARASSVIL